MTIRELRQRIDAIIDGPPVPKEEMRKLIEQVYADIESGKIRVPLMEFDDE